MYGIGFFLYSVFLFFFRRLGFIKNYSTAFEKIGTIGNSANSSVCLYNLLVSFYLIPLSKAFEKVSGGIWPNILDFFTFSQKLPLQIWDFGFNE